MFINNNDFYYKIVLQVRLELTTSALLYNVLSYKYRALTDCATGACAAHSSDS